VKISGLANLLTPTLVHHVRLRIPLSVIPVAAGIWGLPGLFLVISGCSLVTSSILDIFDTQQITKDSMAYQLICVRIKTHTLRAQLQK